ncbi:MAG TPA: TRIC cation channel family protein, partial [Bryobacteraceae bacterium]|nr:TRIC cation channel family protein [Bryobacteraceae bacterium]
LAFDIHPFIAILMGGITGVGGGTVRDVLLAQIPTVLRADVHAVAALAGAAVMVAGLRAGGPRTPMTILGAVVCFLLRMVAVWQHWSLPKAG